MNWQTNVPFENLPIPEDYDRCEHVEADPKCAYILFKEDDSFGPVMRHVDCKACAEKAFAEEAEKVYTCNDCKKQFKQKDLTTWKWYDFYAAQGDEPLLLCKECRKGEKHKKRVAEDRDSSEWEEEQLLRYDM